MGLLTKKILGINISTASKKEILEEIGKYIKKFKVQSSKFKVKKIKPLIIFTPNPEIITYAKKDKNFAQIVNSAQINIPDGAGIVWAIKKIYGADIKRISGVDLMLELVRLAQKSGFTVGLIGGRSGVALEALECLRKAYPKLRGWAMEGPEIEKSNIKNQISKIQIKNQKGLKDTSGVTEWAPPRWRNWKEEIEQIIAKIIKENTAILFVAFGFPKQEYFIHLLAQYLTDSDALNQKRVDDLSDRLDSQSKPLVMMAVGGAFDYICGRVPRAPVWVRDRGWEWLYRLVKEPWRLSRQLKGAEFFYRVLLK